MLINEESYCIRLANNQILSQITNEIFCSEKRRQKIKLIEIIFKLSNGKLYETNVCSW